MEWREYRREWLRRAFRGNLLKAELVAGLAALVSAPLGQSKVWGPVVSWLPTIVFAVVGVVLCTYGLLRAPYWLHEELARERDELRERLRPQIKIIRLNEETDPPNAAPRHGVRLYSITVQNVGGEHLTGCLAKASGFSGSDGIGLITRHQYMQGRRGGRFDLRPGELKDIMLARLDERNDNSDIEMLFESKDYDNRLPRSSKYEMTVTVYKTPTPPLARYAMQMENGRLRVTEITPESA